MPELTLASSFPASDEKQWRALVEKALRGADFDESLVSESYDGIEIKPLFTRADEVPPAAAGIVAGRDRALRPWDIRQLHADSDPQSANRAILADLEGGVTSITLRIAAPEQSGLTCDPAALSAALKGVRLDLAGILLDAGERFEAAAHHLQSLWREVGIADDEALGGFGADPLGTLARAGGLGMALDQALEAACRLAAMVDERFPRVTALLADSRPYHDAGASEAEEIAALLATTVTYLRALEDHGLPPERALPRIAFAMAADGDQFATIAKLRAARACLARIAEASDAGEATTGLSIAAQTSARMMARRDPHVNLLRTTVACAAAALGGADAITVLPYSWPLGRPDAFARRIARNIQIILQEESTLGHVTDPSAGSWYVESLTRELAEKAWGHFQDIEAKGGMAAALGDGRVQAMIRETAEARARNIAIAREELTGVSAFPDLGDATDAMTPRPPGEPLDDPAITVEPLPPRRPAAPFEALRDAADRHADESGGRPEIFLATIGRPADYNERARYARNVFAAGGIAATAGDALEDGAAITAAAKESGARIACICSSDEIYTERAEETARALAAAGMSHVYLAGRPGDRRAAYREAGVGTFIHKGVDILEILREAHSILGIRPV